MMRIFVFTWIVFPYLFYVLLVSSMTPPMMWTFLSILILLELGSFVADYIMIRIAAWFVGLKTRIATRIFGARMAGWIIGN